MGLRVYGGGYYYQDNSGNSINGASARMQANLIAGLDAQVQVTYDNFFQTRAVRRTFLDIRSACTGPR